MKNSKLIFLLSIVAVFILSIAVYYKFMKVYFPEIQISEKKVDMSRNRNMTLAESIGFLKSLQETWAENGIEADNNSQKTMQRLQLINVLSSLGIIVSLIFFGWLIMKTFRQSRQLAPPDGKTL